MAACILVICDQGGYKNLPTVGVLGAAFCDSRNVSKVKLKIGTY
jgi:hypothetical protein